MRQFRLFVKELQILVYLPASVLISPGLITSGDYFAPYGEHKTSDRYFTSNYDLSAFSSQFVGAGIRMAPPKGVFGMEHVNMLEVRYGHYTRTTDMVSDVVSVNLRFK